MPEFQEMLAKEAIETIITIGHTKDLEELEQFVQQGGVPEAIQVLKTGRDLMQQARAAYKGKTYNTAITTARTSREAFSKAYFLSHTSIEKEGRAVWNHSGLGAYPGDWNRSAKELAAAGINMIFPNVAWAGVAHYPSKILPQSKTFSQYGDQLAQCVTAAYKHGLEVHAWKITWNLEGAPKEFITKMREAGRTQVSATGKPLNWLCPSHPENVSLELESMLEIVANYDVDGIHLDYIRYPGSHACYCEECRKRFTLTTRQKIEEWPAAVLPQTGTYSDQYVEWRTQQITRLVRLLHKRVREVDPDLKISAAVFGGYPACVTSIGQDWIAWANAGYIDFVCPMNYTENTDYFTELLVNQLALMPKDVAIYPGIGATASNSLLSSDAVIEQIYFVPVTWAARGGQFLTIPLTFPRLCYRHSRWVLGSKKRNRCIETDTCATLALIAAQRWVSLDISAIDGVENEDSFWHCSGLVAQQVQPPPNAIRAPDVDSLRH